MEHPKLRLNTQTNIFNRMFHIFFCLMFALKKWMLRLRVIEGTP